MSSPSSGSHLKRLLNRDDWSSTVWTFMPKNARNRFVRYQLIVITGMLICLLLAGLHPFDFLPTNGAHWRLGQNGVRFEGYGQVYGNAKLPWSVPQAAGGASPAEFTMELWVASRKESLFEVTDLVSVYRSRHEEPFAIEQWRSGVVLGGKFQDVNGRRLSEHIGVGRILTGGACPLITVTTGRDGTAIYVDGALEVRDPRLMLSGHSLEGILLLGQTGRARQEWQGDILGLAIYPRRLSSDEVVAHDRAWHIGRAEELLSQTSEGVVYTFNERRGTVVHNLGGTVSNLVLPPRLRAIDPVILEAPSWSDLMNISDVTLNILGLVPFGALLVIYWKSTKSWSSEKALLWAVLSGFAVSLFIEVLQVLLPSRDSSLLDLINNTVGTGAGGVLGTVVYPWLQKAIFSRS